MEKNVAGSYDCMQAVLLCSGLLQIKQVAFLKRQIIIVL